MSKESILIFLSDYWLVLTYYSVVLIVVYIAIMRISRLHRQKLHAAMLVSRKTEEIRFMSAATMLYEGPQGTRYCALNGYHDVAIHDIATIIKREAEFMVAERIRLNQA